jgi:hypothetical protein
VFDEDDNTITLTPTTKDQMYYEIPVVFVVNASTVVYGKDSTGGEGSVRLYGSEVDAARLVAEVLEDHDFSSGSEATPWLDCWTMPANQDVTGADNRSGTIVYGSDCGFLARLCQDWADAHREGDRNAEHVDTARRLQAYLSRYVFNG